MAHLVRWFAVWYKRPQVHDCCREFIYGHRFPYCWWFFRTISINYIPLLPLAILITRSYRSIFADESLCWLRLLCNYIGSKGRDGRDGRCCMSLEISRWRLQGWCVVDIDQCWSPDLVLPWIASARKQEKGDVVTARPASLGKDLAEATQPQGLQSEIWSQNSSVITTMTWACEALWDRRGRPSSSHPKWGFRTKNGISRKSGMPQFTNMGFRQQFSQKGPEITHDCQAQVRSGEHLDLFENRDHQLKKLVNHQISGLYRYTGYTLNFQVPNPWPDGSRLFPWGPNGVTVPSTWAWRGMAWETTAASP